MIPEMMARTPPTTPLPVPVPGPPSATTTFAAPLMAAIPPDARAQMAPYVEPQHLVAQRAQPGRDQHGDRDTTARDQCQAARNQQRETQQAEGT